jgi:hypothetical protein
MKVCLLWDLEVLLVKVVLEVVRVLKRLDV